MDRTSISISIIYLDSADETFEVYNRLRYTYTESWIRTTHVRVLRGAECGCDHHLLKATLLFSFKRCQLHNKGDPEVEIKEVSTKCYMIVKVSSLSRSDLFIECD